MRRFWWQSEEDKHKINWVSWYEITKSKSQGITRGASHAWRSRHQCLPILREGLRHVVSNGEDTKIWTDQWLPTRPPRPPRPKPGSTIPNIQVSFLFQSNKREWDMEKLLLYIHPEDIQIIRRIRLSYLDRKDTVEWIYTKHGGYAVKSGYHLIHNNFTSEANPANQNYKRLWKTNAPPKSVQRNLVFSSYTYGYSRINTNRELGNKCTGNPAKQDNKPWIGWMQQIKMKRRNSEKYFRITKYMDTTYKQHKDLKKHVR